MLQAERMEKIRDYLMEHKYASVNDLTEVLEASPATVRRCLAELEAKHILERTHGGAVAIGSGNTYEHPYSIKRRQNEAEKKRIAAYAASLVGMDESIYLDASSTVREMTVPLKTRKNITVCTNDVLIAGDLSCAEGLIVMVTGGVMRQGYYSLSGFSVDCMLSNMIVDYAFMGIDCIDTDGSMMLTNLEEVGAKQTIAGNAKTAVVLADHDKFGKSAFFRVWQPSEISTVITGVELSDELFRHYTALGLNIIRV